METVDTCAIISHYVQSIPLLLLRFIHCFLGQLGFLLQLADLFLQTSSQLAQPHNFTCRACRFTVDVLSTRPSPKVSKEIMKSVHLWML